MILYIVRAKNVIDEFTMLVNVNILQSINISSIGYIR